MKILKSILFVLIGLLIMIGIVYFLGPQIKFEDYNNVPVNQTYNIGEIEAILSGRNNNSLIKKNNEEKIIWVDSLKKTKYAMVYIHGFSASHEEGAPIHQNIAKKIGANLFLTRLPQHGLTDSLAFDKLTPKLMVDYAKEAVKIGKSIGEKVIIMSCSTGGTLSAYLSAGDPDIAAQIMFSPNFEMFDNTTKILTKPWGLQLARIVKGGDYHSWNTPQIARPFWYHKYKLEGVVALQSLVDNTMTNETFASITQPVFVGYYYRDEQNQDFTISVERIREVQQLLNVKSEEARFIAYPNGGAHVFISPIFNPNWEEAQTDAMRFLDEVMGIKEVSLKIPELVEEFVN